MYSIYLMMEADLLKEKKSPRSRRQMSEAHDNTEEEKSVSYLRLMRWGTRNFF
jgi:hypothetical protein